MDRRSAQWARQVATRVLPRVDTGGVKGMATGEPTSESRLHRRVADRALFAGGGRGRWGYRVVVRGLLVRSPGPGPGPRRARLLLNAHVLASPSPAAARPMPMAVVLMEPSDGQLGVKATRVVFILHETPTYLPRSTNDVYTQTPSHGHSQHPPLLLICVKNA